MHFQKLCRESRAFQLLFELKNELSISSTFQFCFGSAQLDVINK